MKIASVPGLRPTPERIRETLFNWLAPRIAGARCLDLYAGSGALGLEALSRGAASVTFVERSREAVEFLQSACRTLEADNAHVHAGDAVEYLRSGGDDRFDIVFLDPPFADDALGELCRLLADSRRLAPGARIYLEQGRDQPEPDLPAGWKVTHQKTAGKVRYSLAEAP